jgi:Ca-activated chloride channel homolog
MSADPRELLTAYADGQLDPERQAAVEQAMAASPALQAELHDIRAMQAAVRALPAAPVALRDPVRENLLRQAEQGWQRPPRRRTWLRRMLPYALAAGFVLVVGGLVLPAGMAVRHASAEQLTNAVGTTSAADSSRADEPQSTVSRVPAAPFPTVVEALKADGPMGGTRQSTGQLAESEMGASVAKGSERAREEADGLAVRDRGYTFLSAGQGRRTSPMRQGYASEKKERASNLSADLPAAEPQVDELLTSIVTAAAKPIQSKSKQDKDALLPQFPTQSPVMLAMQLANIAPAPLLTADPELRLRNIAEQYQLPLSIPDMPLQRLLAGRALPTAPGLSAGEQVLMLANRAGVQVVLANGRLGMQAPVALDPTDRLGLEPAAFASAWGTPPMAIVAQDPQLTFALDADTASFDRARSDLAAGRLPDPAGIRPEHFVNAVPADYPTPTGSEAFALYAEAGPSLFARGPVAGRSALVAVGVVGRAANADERKALRLVIALDASGSMARSGALDRARIALDGLIGKLTASDRVAVVAYGEQARVVLQATAGSDSERLRAALHTIETAGATNTAEGLALACQLAREMAEPGTALRVVLVTDGAAIAGAEEGAARTRVATLRAVGGSLLVLGVGEQAADTRALDGLVVAGDGQQVHLGSDADARRAVDGALLPARLMVLARDAKAQVTWNPERVTHARLVGYERRRLSHDAFRDDRVDAGELPSTTVVTALFEVILVDGGSGPLGTAAVRYLDTRLDTVRELACPMPGSILQPVASPRLRALACAAELAEQLRGSWWANVRPTAFSAIASACADARPLGDELARMATQAAALRPSAEAHP